GTFSYGLAMTQISGDCGGSGRDRQCECGPRDDVLEDLQAVISENVVTVTREELPAVSRSLLSDLPSSVCSALIMPIMRTSTRPPTWAGASIRTRMSSGSPSLRARTG